MEHISKTTARDAVEECVAYSRAMKEASAVFGPAGVGKSTALRWIAENDRNSYLIYIGSTRSTPLSVVTLIADALEVHSGSRSGWRLMEIVESHLEHWSMRDAIIMFDEAQYIPIKLLKDIVDFPARFKVPVLICGNEHLLKYQRTERAAFDQIGHF